MTKESISRLKMIKSSSKVLNDFRKNPSKVFFDTLNVTIDNSYVYGVNKKQVLLYLDKKIKELEKEI